MNTSQGIPVSDIKMVIREWPSTQRPHTPPAQVKEWQLPLYLEVKTGNLSKRFVTVQNGTDFFLCC
jgi:hypothetical protein